MNPLKKLASQTAIYGFSHIAGRMLNFLFLPLYTGVFSKSDYGVLSLLLVAVAFMNIVFTYGMETAYFRFVTKERGKNVYATAVYSLFASSLIFSCILWFFDLQIAQYFDIKNKLNFIHWFIGIIVLDTMAIIPLARLRLEGKALKYSGIKLMNVAIIIFFNLIFLLPLIPKLSHLSKYLPYEYNPEIGIGYIILANLIASGSVLLLLTPSLIKINGRFDKAVFNSMIKFGAPLLLVGMAGMINEMLDRILLKELLTGSSKIVNGQIGIYSACYKLAMIIALANTAFRQAAEPFFFKQEKENNSKNTYAKILKYYSISCLVIALLIALFLEPIANLMIHPSYHDGLRIVPILLLANILLGMYYNLSVWYKLTQKTVYGMYIAIIGAGITLGMNFLLIPTLGFYGSAIATLVCYFSMLVISYFLGKKHYPIAYPMGRITLYFIFGISLYFIESSLDFEGVLHWINKALILCTFLIAILIIERPKNSLNSA